MKHQHSSARPSLAVTGQDETPPRIRTSITPPLTVSKPLSLAQQSTRMTRILHSDEHVKEGKKSIHQATPATDARTKRMNA